MPLSLSPRYDLMKFHLPKDFIPEEIEEKYSGYINSDAYTLMSVSDYLNESIQGITIPGISELTTTQQQHGSNGIARLDHGLKKRINVETNHEITYFGTKNPLENIEKEFKVTFRANQGLLNYFILYETAFHYACREYNRPCEPVMYIEILSEDGTAIAKVKFIDIYMDGIEGLEFNYSKIEREANTFDVTFKFNNIDFEYLINKDYKG